MTEASIAVGKNEPHWLPYLYILSFETMMMSQCNLLFSVGMVSKPVQEPTPEFQIQQEDFPALPGTSKSRIIIEGYIKY